MDIKELEEKYPLVYERAKIAYNEHVSSSKDFTRSINYAFDWSASKEGRSFWSNMNSFKIEEAMKIFPHLFNNTFELWI